MEEDYVMIPGSGTKKIIRDVKKEIETAFLDYSMSVIVCDNGYVTDVFTFCSHKMIFLSSLSFEWVTVRHAG